jgi:nitrile hydratase accessory protein
MASFDTPATAGARADHVTLTGAEDAPDTPFNRPSFANSWSLRVFAVTLAAAETGTFTLQEFQQALIAQIQAWEASGHCIDSDESYYTRWAEALTELLLRKNALPAGRLPGAEQVVRDALLALQHDHDHEHEHPAHQNRSVRPLPLHIELPQ